MKLTTSPNVHDDFALGRAMRDAAIQVNLMSEGRIAGAYNALPAPPTAGEYQVGDFVRNSAPVELGAPGSKYVIFGWQNVAAGNPGTFVEMRFLTGN